MKEHPEHFWVCFWLMLVIVILGGDLADIRKAIEANTEAVKSLQVHR